MACSVHGGRITGLAHLGLRVYTYNVFCRGLDVLTGQVRLWSTFWRSPHLYRWWFMSSIYEYDLNRSMCVNKTRTAKVVMSSVTQFWFWNVHHHHIFLRQRWVNVSSLLDHQRCTLQVQLIIQLNVLTYMPTMLRSTPPPSGLPLRKRSAMILVEVSQ